jgi:hypothetical protein
MKMGSWFTLMFALLVASKVHAQQTRDLVRDGHGGLRVQVDVGQVRITGMGCTPAPCSTFERYALGLTVELHQRITTLSPDLHLEFDLEAIAGLSEMQDDFGRFNGQWLGSAHGDTDDASLARRRASTPHRGATLWFDR